MPAVDLNGLRRNQYICAAENSQPFSLNCSDIALPPSVAAAPSGTVAEVRPKNSPGKMISHSDSLMYIHAGD